MPKLNQRRPKRGAASGQMHTPADGALPLILRLGPLGLLLAGSVTGALGVHSTTDLWIGLACGRYILDHGEVPTTDPFSFTFSGQPFFNQNWLSHVIFFWLYDRIAPTAVLVFIWLIDAAIFAYFLFAARLRSGSWLAALLAAGAVAAASRHYLDARPQTVGYLCLMAACALLHHFSTQRRGRSCWPALLLLPVLLVWGNAHGSFIFGYGLLGLFVGCWLVTRLTKRLTVPAAGVQVIALCAVALVALLLTIALGPYGLENFTHARKVGGSEVFRNVAEWHPPWRPIGQGLEVWPFWVVLGLGGASLLVAWLTAQLSPASSRPVRPSAFVPHITLFDLVLIGLGLCMALWARRFAPLFYILATPSATALIVRLAAGASGGAARLWRPALLTASWIAAVLLGAQAYTRARHDLIVSYEGRSDCGLLQRFVGHRAVPVDTLGFLKQIDVPIRIISEWTVAGPIMFELPQAKVFIDGRSQQVYDEVHYVRYNALFRPREFDPVRSLAFIESFGTDAALLRRRAMTVPLLEAFGASPGWVAALYTPQAVLYLRRGAPPWTRLLERERAGELSWPDFPESLAARGYLWMEIEPPDYERALELMKAAVARDIMTGLVSYGPMAEAWHRLGQYAEAIAYFEGEQWRVRSAGERLSEEDRRVFLQLLGRCRQQLRREPVGRPAPEPPAP